MWAAASAGARERMRKAVLWKAVFNSPGVTSKSLSFLLGLGAIAVQQTQLQAGDEHGPKVCLGQRKRRRPTAAARPRCALVRRQR